MSTTKLEQMKQLLQAIHNLKMRFPIGIRSIDNEHDERLKRLEKILKEIYNVTF